jgi:hypothetical protein
MKGRGDAPPRYHYIFIIIYIYYIIRNLWNKKYFECVEMKCIHGLPAVALWYYYDYRSHYNIIMIIITINFRHDYNTVVVIIIIYAVRAAAVVVGFITFITTI